MSYLLFSLIIVFSPVKEINRTHFSLHNFFDIALLTQQQLFWLNGLRTGLWWLWVWRLYNVWSIISYWSSWRLYAKSTQYFPFFQSLSLDSKNDIWIWHHTNATRQSRSSIIHDVPGTTPTQRHQIVCSFLSLWPVTARKHRCNQ